MNRLKWSLLLIAILLISCFASSRVITAFSVGHLKIKENSERGFVAEVPFELSEGEQGKRVRVSLGGPGHYALLSKERPGELDQMRVRVDKERGKAYIESQSPLRRSLDMIVQVTVDGGTILKKFPIVLKSTLPPSGVKVAIDSARRVAGHLRSAVPQPKEQPGAQVAAPPIAEHSQSVVPLSKKAPAVYGPVRRGETLWQIASSLAVPDLPQESVVVALWRRNLGQFAFGNMHALRANSYLDCSNLQPSASAVSRDEALSIVRQQWAELKKVKLVSAAAARPTPPLVHEVTVAHADEKAPSGNTLKAAAQVSSSHAVASVPHRVKVAMVANRVGAEGVRAASERRAVQVREASIGPLAKLQMGMERAVQAKQEQAHEQPVAAARLMGGAPRHAELALAPDIARLKEELAATKDLLLGRIGGLEGEFAEKILHSDRMNRLFYAIFLVENLVLLVILLISMRKRRAREQMAREAQPARSRVYVRNALHHRYL